MKVTVWGTATQIGGLACTRNRSGSITSARSYDDLELELPEDGIVVDLDHSDERVGELIFAELGEDDRLRVVTVLDDDRIAGVPEPIFFSPELEMIGAGVHERTYVARSASLLSLALTLEPATLAAQPVSWRRGDLRRSTERRDWPISWRGSDPLLARAADYLRGSSLEMRTRRVVDRRPSGDYPWRYRGEGQPVAPATERPTGPWRRGPRGRVISVR